MENKQSYLEKNYIKENYPSLDIIRGGGIKGGKRSGNWCRIKHLGGEIVVFLMDHF